MSVVFWMQLPCLFALPSVWIEKDEVLDTQYLSINLVLVNKVGLKLFYLGLPGAPNESIISLNYK